MNKARLYEKSLFSILFIFLSALSIEAQDSNGQLKIPSSPLLRSAPNYSEWIITFSYPEDVPRKIDATAPSKYDYINSFPRSVTTVKTENMIREDLVDLVGRSSEKFFTGNIEYFKNSGDSTWYEDRTGTDTINGYSNATTASGYDFHGFEGVSAQTYRGTIKYDNHDCLVFIIQKDATNKISNEKDLTNVTHVLLVDDQSRLPVEARDNGVIRAFQFVSPPSVKLTLPSDLTAQLDKANEALKRLDQRPPRS